MKILVLNCGSSSLKFELLELDSARQHRGRTIAKGTYERIGEARPDVRLNGPRGESQTAVELRDHHDAALHAIAWLEEVTSAGALQVDATAHRIVHGGNSVFGPVIIDDAVVQQLQVATEFAPLHNPPALGAIAAVRERLPNMPAIALADTAFHRDLPEHARTYALPREVSRRHGVRRFGFHGLGHAWMVERYAELNRIDVSSLNAITLHLGAGCSATAIKGGKSIDTSMGLTPLEGLMMATRSGDLDPAIVGFLCEREKISPAQVEEMLNHRSGLLGVSGSSPDMRDVIKAADGGSRDAALAIAMFCYRIRKYIGGYLAAVGPIEAIIFGGGIGEHSDRIREQILIGLEHLGVAIDPELNTKANGRERCFSAAASKIKVFVIPLDEELYLARAAAGLLAQRGSQ